MWVPAIAVETLAQCSTCDNAGSSEFSGNKLQRCMELSYGFTTRTPEDLQCRVCVANAGIAKEAKDSAEVRMQCSICGRWYPGRGPNAGFSKSQANGTATKRKCIDCAEGSLERRIDILAAHSERSESAGLGSGAVRSSSPPRSAQPSASSIEVYCPAHYKDGFRAAESLSLIHI